MSTRTLRTAAALGVVLVASLTTGLTTASATQSQPTSPAHKQTVPENLVVPPGNTQVAKFAATGVQIYQCTNSAWTFVEPAASLIGFETAQHKPNLAIHFRGPSWQSTTDGSLVEAKSIATSPVEGAIPQLLLQASKTRGDGVFGKVTYVQRLNTKGGLAPTTTCTDGATTSVPYKADYRFFAASAS